MAIIESKKLHHWQYFLAVEADLHRLSRFIEFSADNFQTYSIELVRILLASSAEVAIVAQQLCENLDPGCRMENMDGYRCTIIGAKPILGDTEVEIPRYGLMLRPWDNWRENRSPDWWRAYNAVKHQRHERYSEANLKNTLNSVCGLFLLLLFLYRKQAEAGELMPNPVMLRLGMPFKTDRVFWGEVGNFTYFLNSR
ncbi:MAG: hypothetical protein H8K10_17930 [Nitrospira sp.]|nr:hypothetical protein [Nitrospira sp.]